jgi:hypothetical protein
VRHQERRTAEGFQTSPSLLMIDSELNICFVISVSIRLNSITRRPLPTHQIMVLIAKVHQHDTFDPFCGENFCNALQAWCWIFQMFKLSPQVICYLVVVRNYEHGSVCRQKNQMMIFHYDTKFFSFFLVEYKHAHHDLSLFLSFTEFCT